MSVKVTVKDYSKDVIKDQQAKQLKYVVEAGEKMQSDAVLFINNVSGKLAGAIQTSPAVVDGIAECEVGPVSNRAPYAIYVEYGTGVYASPEGHGSKAKKTPWTYQNAQGQWFTTRGSKPYPFMAPAWEKLKPWLRAHEKDLTL